MKDFEVIPEELESYSLFLVRIPKALNKKLLDSIFKDLARSGRIFSFERLIKGEKGALVLFGPDSLMSKYKDSLNLLEIEDYTNISLDQVSGWEMGIKTLYPKEVKGYFKKFPKLLSDEQFFWQVIISEGVQIRAVLICKDLLRRRELTNILQNLSPHLKKTQRNFSSTQIIDFYKKRSFSEENKFLFNSSDILHLLAI